MKQLNEVIGTLTFYNHIKLQVTIILHKQRNYIIKLSGINISFILLL